jgi:hypothetical protein
MERLGAIIQRLGATRSVAIDPANLSTTMIYAHLSTGKRREDLTRFLEGPGEEV